MNLFGALTDNDFISAIAALVFWVGGYIAAPILFMATLGIFRNLAGMGSGFMKNARGKVRDKAGARMQADKNIRSQERDKRRSYAAQRSKYNWRNRGAIKAGDMERVEPAKRRDWRDAEKAIIGAQLAQSDPAALVGQAREQADKIGASAASANLQQEVQVALELILKTNPTMDTGEARENALRMVREKLTEKMDKGTATQADISGAMIFFSQQKSKEVYKLQEHIGGMSGDNRTKAVNMWSSAQGNSDVWSSTQSMSPGLSYVPNTGDDAAEIADKRGKAARKSSPQKLAAMTEQGWKDAFGTDGFDAAGKPVREISDPVMQTEALAAARQLGPEAQKALNLPENIRRML